jgi:DNA adenine methylase
VLKYPGSKGRLAAQIVASFPPHRSYLEPCLGSAAVLLAKPRARLETVNDLDGRVCNLFRVLRDRPDALAQELYWTPFSRQEYYEVAELPETDDPVELARRFLVAAWQSHGSDIKWRNGWRFDTGRSTSGVRDTAGQWARLPGAILAAAVRLRGVHIECKPALEVIAARDHPECLIYCDPPYPRSTRARAYYQHEMTDDDHRALLAALLAHSGPVVVSGYACALYDETLEGWHREQIGAVAENGRVRTEVVWRNRLAAPTNLFTTGRN